MHEHSRKRKENELRFRRNVKKDVENVPIFRSEIAIF